MATWSSLLRSGWLWALPWLLSAGASASAADRYDIQQAIEYARQGDESLKADIYVPRGQGPFPGVLVVHGGAWLVGNRARIAWHAEQLAEHGYTAVAINYRLAPRHPFPAQLEDCQAALCFMRDNAQKHKIDADRLGGYGYSAGGHLVALVGTMGPDDRLQKPAVADKIPPRLRAVVAGGAPCNFCMMPPANPRLAYWLGGTRAECPQAYELASPLQFVTSDDPPMFFFHGEADRLVPIATVKAMVAKLESVGVPASLHTVSEGGHVATYRDQEAMAASIGFLDRYLKDRKPK